jgi:hypothetical protein
MKQSYFKIDSHIPRGDPGFVMSQSELKLFAKNPWAWINGRVVDPSESIEWGSLVDCLLLEGEAEFAQSYKIRPDTYPSGKPPRQIQKAWHHASTWCTEWLKANKKNFTILTVEELRKAERARDAAREDPVVASILEVCDTQVLCRWTYTDPKTGLVIPCKCLIDLAPKEWPFLADFKTSMKGDRHGFTGKAKQFRYDIQAAWYRWGWEEFTGERRDAFAFLVQENKKPYPCSHWTLSLDQIEYGRVGFKGRYQSFEGYEAMLARYCECLATQTWPSYTSELTELVIHS